MIKNLKKNNLKLSKKNKIGNLKINGISKQIYFFSQFSFFLFLQPTFVVSIKNSKQLLLFYRKTGQKNTSTTLIIIIITHAYVKLTLTLFMWVCVWMSFGLGIFMREKNHPMILQKNSHSNPNRILPKDHKKMNGII